MTRDEAIKEAYGIPVTKAQHEALQMLIPELKESEGEKTRKSLIKFLSDIKKISESGRTSWAVRKEDAEMCKSFIVWLEKQKALSELGKYIADKRSKVGFYCNYKEVSWNEIPLEDRKHDYPYYFDGDIDCYPFVVSKQKEQKPIKMEVYETGKGTTICGQDYKCKKDYKEGNCWYIKDVIYHCSRDGYLNDQNGVSWSCTPEWFNEYIYSNKELADKEKNDFVSSQFIQCKHSFDKFKEGEHYWLEYVGNDMYVGRSDNILNQKFHITPRQLYTLFSQQLEEKQKDDKFAPRVLPCSVAWFEDGEEKQKKQKPVDPSDEELQRHQDELYDFKVFAAKQAKEHHISFVHDFEWNNFCAGILSYFNERKPARTAKEMWKEMRLEVYAQASGNRHEPNCSDDSTKMFSLCDIDEIFEKIGNSTVGQKPTEWREKDEENLRLAVELIEYYEMKQGISYKELKLWFKELSNRFRPQPKRDWSEEDEHRITDAIYFLESAKIHYADTSEIEKTINFLKSLRPSWKPGNNTYKTIIHNILAMLKDLDFDKIAPDHRLSLLNDIRVRCKNADEQAEILDEPSWRPSEEQMDALDTILEHEAERVGSSKELEKANALYEQLNKLK